MERVAIENLFTPATGTEVTVQSVTSAELSAGVGLSDAQTRLAGLHGFTGAAGEVMVIATSDGGGCDGVLLGLGDGGDPFVTGALAAKLPEGRFALLPHAALDRAQALVGYGLGAYRFTTYSSASAPKASLAIAGDDPMDAVVRQLEACWLARDLVNTPANDMGPDGIEAAAHTLAKRYKANITVTTGDALLEKNFPMIHAVGRAATRAPRLIDLTWGKAGAPMLTLVGKGVAYDTGGLNIKPGSSMRNMKKDMGGAAHVLALSGMIMDAGLPVRLRVLIPAVENAIAGDAFRPGDILQSRKGLTVEIGNTDAEGRLVLADALTLACEDKPDQIIDMATLTGAARVALGPDIPPFYTTDEAFAADLTAASLALHDPLWRMPLWQPYAKGLKSGVADLCNITTDGFAGSVTAALFLQKFVEPELSWTHLDIFAWNAVSKPHAAVGGEAQTIRALFAALEGRYCQ